ncbi:MAG TPA: MarC family protein [Haliangiales bacterium]|nr:MarC family protein [Haliangiales bacterium]
MHEALEFSLLAFSAVFFVVDPFAAVPIFLAITANETRDERRRTARRAAMAAFVTLTLFALTGGVLFNLLGISVGAFRIAGGVMLFVMALDMMRAQPSRVRTTVEEQEEGIAKQDVAIVPVAIPMLSGPGAIATVMVFMTRAHWRPGQTIGVFLAIVLTCLLSWIVLRAATMADRFLTRTMLHVFERVMGLLLTAIAVEFVVGGLRDIWPQLK